MRGCARRAAVSMVSALLAAAVPGPATAAQPDSDGEMQIAQRRSSSSKTASTAKNQPVWKFSRRPGVPTLQYGAQGGNGIVVSFSCQPKTGLVRVLSLVGSRGLRPGDGAAIRLSSGKTKFEVAGTAFSTGATDAVDIGGATRLDGKLSALFRAGDSMLLVVPGRRRTLPAASGRAGAEAFEKACAVPDKSG